ETPFDSDQRGTDDKERELVARYRNSHHGRRYFVIPDHAPGAPAASGSQPRGQHDRRAEQGGQQPSPAGVLLRQGAREHRLEEEAARADRLGLVFVPDEYGDIE